MRPRVRHLVQAPRDALGLAEFREARGDRVRVVHFLPFLAELVPVVTPAQGLVHLLRAASYIAGAPRDIRLQLGQGAQFPLRKAQQRIEIGIEGNVVEMVRAGEQSGMGQTGDPGHERAAQVFPDAFQRAVKRPHHGQNVLREFRAIHDFGNGRIVFVNQHRDPPVAMPSVYLLDETRQERIGGQRGIHFHFPVLRLVNDLAP